MEKLNTTKEKKAQGHLELVLSMVIFVGFLLAIFIFLNPVKKQDISYVSLEKVQEKIISNVTINYRSIALVLNANLLLATPCFLVKNKIHMLETPLVKTSSEAILQSYLNSTNIAIQYNPGENFYHLYFSENFNSYTLNPSTCRVLEDSNYSFGALSYESSILFENLLALDAAYMDSYSRVVDTLKLEDEFEFGIYDINKSVIREDTYQKHKIKTSNVLSRDILLKSIDKNVTQVDLFMNLRVW
jgi:hypothetical protein